MVTSYTGPDPQAFAPTAEMYDADYYGMGHEPKANYRDYGPHSEPHWARPFALWLAKTLQPPFLDLGAAYGHLCRELTRLRKQALAVEWSAWATAHAVTPRLFRGDIRHLENLFEPGSFGTVTSLDVLEHFLPADTERVIEQAITVSRPQCVHVHLVGAHNPAEDLSRHTSDPTHRNHEPLGWYFAAYERRGFVIRRDLIAKLAAIPAWANTDWSGRWLVAERG
jgi:SAM-dependent methyltransferase